MKPATAVATIVLILGAVTATFLMFRIAVFQRYNPYQRPGAYFGTPHSWSLTYLLDRESYTDEGASLLHWLRLAYALTVLAFIGLAASLMSGLGA